jgi:photosystem II stability/assembly factor-like uncharacterized protein
MRRPLIRIAVVAVATSLAALVLATSASALSTGNGGWRWQNPLPQGGWYQGGWFLNATHGWLISGGDIFFTANGGASLTVQARHNVVDFTDITFVDATHGWAVGGGAGATGASIPILYRTTNGGKLWTRVYLHLSVNGGLNAVSFSTRYVGWAVGGNAALHTVDGGLHWSVHRLPSTDWLVDVQALGVRHAWVCCDVDAVLRTDNGGLTWKRLVVRHPTMLAHLHFTSLLNGWVSGDYGLSYTNDGGASWTTQLAAAGVGMVFSDAQHGWASDATGLYRTTNGGGIWTLQTTAPSGASPVAAPSASTAVIVISPSELSHTTDAGLTWSPVIAPADNYSGGLRAVRFVNSLAGWTVGQAGEILHTTNGGAQWSPQVSGTGLNLHDVTFADANDGWAVGGSSDWLTGAASAVVLRTTDGGATWLPVTNGVTGVSASLGGVAFANANDGWAVGGKDDLMDLSSGVVLHSTDGGQSWAQQTLPESDVQLNDVAFADALHGWAVGDVTDIDGNMALVILATKNGGATWTRQFSYLPPRVSNTSEAALYSVACADDLHAVAVGFGDNGPQILRTVNGGGKWTRVVQPALGYLELWDVVLADASHGWAVGGNYVIATTDGGVSWARQYVGPNIGGMALGFVSRTHGWVVGSGGNILTTTTGGNAP